MKTLGIILSVLLVILVLCGIGLQMFLTKGLTRTLNQGVFPAVKTMYGLEMRIDNASVNILKGKAELQGFAVSNLKNYWEPTLFQFDECVLKIDMMSLLKRDPIIIDLAEVTGAVLTVERNKERQFNLKELADALKPVESNEKPAEQPPAEPVPPQEKAEPVPVHIRRLKINATVLYADSRRNRKFPLDLTLNASDLFSIPASGQPESLIVLRGSMSDDKNSFVTDLNAIVEPLTDPVNPSFNATGSILDIDAEFLQDILESNNMQSGSFSIKPSITCRSGALEGSRIDLILKDLTVYGAKIGETTLPLELKGTIRKPRVDLTAALQALFSKQSTDIIRAIGKDRIKKELGIDSGAKPDEMLMQGLTNNINEIADSPELQNLIRQVLPGAQSTNTAATNRPKLKESIGNILFEQLEKNVDEVQESDTETLKGLFNNLLKK
jgi:hypothetical protein